MILFPAIDIYNGKAVRLLRGDYDKVTVYGEPLDMAQKFEDMNAEWIHVVDLNGAENSGDNFGIIEKIAAKTSLKIEVGGGLRNKNRIKSLFDSGAQRAVLGTVCATDPEAVGEYIDVFGTEKIVCGLDAKNGKVAVRGWKESSDLSPLELGKILRGFGAKYFLYTDVVRDGMLTGVNVDATAALSKELSANVIASGGVKDINDIKELLKHGIYGAIVGKAYYENKIDLQEAIKLCMN